MTTPIYLFSISSNDETISINSLDIKLLKPSIDFSNYDYIIITSKQVSEVLKQYEKKEFVGQKALCVSVASASSFKEIGGDVLEIGGGYGDNLVDKIHNHPKETRWLYLRAKIVASDFVSVCRDDGYNIDEIVVYESGCSKAIDEVKIQKNATLIFTSPSSVNCFLKNHSISLDDKVIVIGKTTAKALPKNIEYIISDNTTIQSCIDIAKKL